MRLNIEKILTETFDTLDKEINKYVVMNKYDVLPYELPSDIDICVAQEDFIRLDDIVKNIAKNTNTVVTQKIWHNYRKCAYILSPLRINSSFRLQLDFFSDFSVESTPKLIPFEEILKNTRKVNRFTVPAYEVEYVFLLLRRIYKNDFSLEHVKIIKEILIKSQKSISEYALKYFDKDVIEVINDLLIKEDIEKLKEMQPYLWKNVKRLSKRNSFGIYYLKYWTSQIYRAVYRLKNPVGLSIAILAPDGGGKTTIIEGVSSLVSGSFHGIDKRYIRPRLFKNLGSYKVFNPSEESSSNPNPHDKPLNNPIKSIIRFLFYNLDYQIGTILDINIKKVKKKLIIFDRYYFDYYVDLKRFQYNMPEWLPRVFSWSIPNPNIIFVLDAPAEVLYKRKQELPIEELRRQRNAYYNLKNNVKNVVVIDATKTIEEVVEEITTIILEKKAKQTLKLLK